MSTSGTQHMGSREFREALAAAAPGETITYAERFIAASIHQARIANARRH